MTSSKRKIPTWDEVAATAFGLGMSPLGPGTAGSIGAALGYWFIGGAWYWWLAATVVACVVGVAAGPAMETKYGDDPSIFVLDEVAGTWIALLGARHSVWVVIAGLVLFRLFDIAKPWPISTAERLPAGWGIMADDVVAGIAALAVLQGGLALLAWQGVL